MQVLDSNRITLTWGSSSHELFYTVWFVNKPGRLTWQALKNETHVHRKNVVAVAVFVGVHYAGSVCIRGSFCMEPMRKRRTEENGYRIIFDRNRTCHGCICGVGLQGACHGESEQKAGSCDWSVFWWISGADAFCWMAVGNPVPTVYHIR